MITFLPALMMRLLDAGVSRKENCYHAHQLMFIKMEILLLNWKKIVKLKILLMLPNHDLFVYHPMGNKSLLVQKMVLLEFIHLIQKTIK
jgi:hypothetical protein